MSAKRRAIILDHLNDLMNYWSNEHRLGNLKLSKPVSLLFPTHVCFHNTPNLFGIEMLGASKSCVNLQQFTVSHKRDHEVFNFVGESPCEHVFVLGEGNNIINAAIFSKVTKQELSSRFPISDNFELIFQNSAGTGCPIGFREGFVSCGFRECLFAWKNNDAHRAKYVNSMVLFRKNIDVDYVGNYILGIERGIRKGEVMPFGIAALDQTDADARIAIANLQALYLSPSVRETTIGGFMKSHKKIFSRAFNSESLIFEQRFPWVAGSPEPSDTAIQPDLMIKRSDGSYDICDLKLAKVDKKSLVKSNAKRRRFVDYVGEGIAQLFHYREYFSIVANRDFARRNLGIEVQNPKLVLVVGNIENLKVDAVEQALRPFKEIEIVDYDTLMARALMAK